MATSGTVAQTALDTAVVIEHAVRRCGIPASMQTPESVEIAKQNLYLLLLNLANRGLNLWCVDKQFVGLVSGQAVYALPAGTLRVLNVSHSTTTRITGTDTATANSHTTQLSSPSRVLRYGFKPTSDVTSASFTIESSDDGVTWVPRSVIATADWVAGKQYWVEPESTASAEYYKISSTTNFSLDEFYLASSVKDLPLTQFNRDEYSQQSNKFEQKDPCTNFYFEKLIEPSLTVWPIPSGDYNHLTVWRHRFIQDIGSLTQQIEAPQQWMEAIVWMLAARLAYELPGVDPARRTEVIQASERFLIDAEMSESDNAPVYWVPGIGVYTR